MKTKNEKQRLRAISESLSYAIENEFSEVVIQTLQAQHDDLNSIVESDKAKRKAFSQALRN